MIDYPVPFIGNTPDNLHCLQAAYGMIRKYFETDWQLDWDEWSQTTGYKEGLGTWSTTGLIWFKEHGYDVKHFRSFDYREFIRDAPAYLLENLGPEIGEWEIRFSDLPYEQRKAAQMLALNIWEQRTPTLQDIYNLLDEGYLLKAVVNLRALNDEPDFLGHAVVIKGYTSDKTELILHDPGLPHHADRTVPITRFAHAWSDFSEDTERLDAIKKIT